MPPSSQASNELSTASLTVVRRALRGLSKPRRWRFLAKNSLTAISFCLVAIVSAVSRRMARLMGRLGFRVGAGAPFFLAARLGMNRLSPAVGSGASSVALDEPIRGLLALAALPTAFR